MEQGHEVSIWLLKKSKMQEYPDIFPNDSAFKGLK